MVGFRKLGERGSVRVESLVFLQRQGLTLGQALMGRSLLDPGPWHSGLLWVVGGVTGTVVSLLAAGRGKVVAA